MAPAVQQIPMFLILSHSRRPVTRRRIAFEKWRRSSTACRVTSAIQRDRRVTMTGIYNVLSKLHTGAELSKTEREVPPSRGLRHAAGPSMIELDSSGRRSLWLAVARGRSQRILDRGSSPSTIAASRRSGRARCAGSGPSTRSRAPTRRLIRKTTAAYEEPGAVAEPAPPSVARAVAQGMRDWPGPTWPAGAGDGGAGHGGRGGAPLRGCEARAGGDGTWRTLAIPESCVRHGGRVLRGAARRPRADCA